MPKGFLSLISSLTVAFLLILSALIFKSQPSQAAPSPFPIKEIRGACYMSGKDCEDDKTEKECAPRGTNTFHYFQAGGKCIAGTEVLTDSHWIERCTDRRRLAEAEKICREKLEAEVKEQESGKSPSPICAGKFKSVLPVIITDSYVDKGVKLCLANCAMVYQCTDTPILTPAPPTESPLPSSSDTVPPPPPGY